jgi:hypothetical protein
MTSGYWGEYRGFVEAAGVSGVAAAREAQMAAFMTVDPQRFGLAILW